ncbi:hypothetical protein PsYK624_120980 [Phanerochaete sordida]|uniref:F-box domain-containing protein n=1 Tax=Phanerochaete sordida TaxID=48140 RepID=A0A9P3LJ66_9APHY|nr:hypothetical protein PsYK624_120980 [Phanerochaete sordida]
MTEVPGCTVPQELADMIINHLDDSQSLQQCSLVCKSWEASSTVHLFSRLSWPPCSVCWVRPAMRGVCDCPRHTLTFDDCHDFLLSSHRLRAVVAHLRITGIRGSSGLPEVEGHEPLPLTFLFTLPELLPGLQTLEIWDLRTGAGVMGPPPNLSANPGSLDKLILAGTVLWDDRAIFSILSAFSHIDHLVLECYSSEEDLEEDIPLASQLHRRFPCTSVNRLEVLNPSYLTDVLCCLHEQLDVSALREVKVHLCLGKGLERLIASALSLEALTFMTTESPPKLPNPAALRVLDMMCSIMADDPEEQPDASQFCKFGWGEMIHNLAALHAPELRELTLGVMLRELGYWAEDAGISQEVFAEALARRLQEEDWGTFRAIMSARPKLRKFKLKIVVNDGWTSFQYMVPYLECSARTFQDAVVSCLGRDIESILEVVAEHHYNTEEYMNYYRYP